MTNDLVASETTLVKGYFNPNSWPININLSCIGGSIEVAPMDYIVDRVSGRRVNDPVFEQLVGPKKLSRELGTKPVPILRLAPPSALTAPSGQATPVGHRVRSADGKKWVEPAKALPAAPQNMQRAADANSRPFKEYTMEEARRLGLMGKQRLVPEDFGASEVSGEPSHGEHVPFIKHSIESAPKGVKARPLSEDFGDMSQTPQNAGIVKALQAVAVRPPMENVDLSNRGSVNQLMTRATSVPIAAPAIEEGALEEPATIVPSIKGGRPVDLPPPDLGEESAEPAMKAASEKTCDCPVCGECFLIWSLTAKHVKEKHPEQYAAAMALIPLKKRNRKAKPLPAPSSQPAESHVAEESQGVEAQEEQSMT